MGLYEGGLFKVSRKLDGKGRLQLPGDFREAVGFALDEEVEIAAVMLKAVSYTHLTLPTT